MKKKKGIFCLEGLWERKMSDKSSVMPILEVLERRDKINYIHQNCATIEEFEFFLKKWKTKEVSDKYPILYFAYHGNEDGLIINLTPRIVYPLKKLGEFLEDSCHRKVLFFASCETMGAHGLKIRNFLRKIDAIAVIGFRVTVDWIPATAFELLVLNELQQRSFSKRGMRSISNKINEEYGKLKTSLGFRFEIND